ncbi:MAG TPA: hypothetical protein PLZ45_01255 [Ferruginibacter sp.]|nr:hypothetical protein [Chitinophagaceae bacterium]HRI23264.1 hypothetical protein [Ferruginibacter sp.]
MIPVLLLLYLKKNRKLLISKLRALLPNLLSMLTFPPLLIICMTAGKVMPAQTRQYQYEVKKGGDRIGEIVITHTVSGAVNSLQLVSDIRYRFILLFTAKSREEVIFSNGIMTYSSIYREQNGDKKFDTKTRKASSNYIIEKGSGIKTDLDIPEINYQTICLYIMEPVGRRQVYVDKYQQLVSIHKMAAHHYKIIFPDGDYNEYFYENGICCKVKVTTTYFNAELKLKKIS